MGIGSNFKDALRFVLLLCLIRPLIWFFLGVGRCSQLKLPEGGRWIVAVNHNSHLDAWLILSLLPVTIAHRARCVAAADYFHKLPVVSWFLFGLWEMIPVWRKAEGTVRRASKDCLMPLVDALKQDRVLILFPEGTRGAPEQRSKLKAGIAKLALRCPEARILPVYIRGLGKSLPRGERVFVPLVPQVIQGEPLSTVGKTRAQIMEELNETFVRLESRTSKSDWVDV